MLSANLGYELSGVERLIKPELAGGALLDVGVYPINFASMFFGNDIEKITSTCVKIDSGMDAEDAMIFSYKDGRIATLHAGMMAATEQYGIIYGTKGYLIAYNINNIDKIEVFTKDRTLVRTIEVPKQITGYEYEVEACKRALEDGQLECEEMPHSETVKIMEQMDALREDWGVRYPFE